MAQAYAGHQFGGYQPRLGDGRALLLGEVLDVHGCRRDLHLKGSGRTPFARGGDGKAAVGPMLREYVHRRSDARARHPHDPSPRGVATGEEVVRETMLPGAVLVRVAASHIRVGTFQYAAAQADPELLRRLADYAIARHHPAAAEAENPYVAFFEAVVDAQASLIARWMGVGFIHGVMNTDNMTISGETIDYGPCAFMDTFDPATVFSSIDHGGRYAYGNQPPVAQWNLARLGERLLALIDEDAETALEAANGVLGSFPDRYLAYWRQGMRAKLGLAGSQAEDAALGDDLLGMLYDRRSTSRRACARCPLRCAAMREPARSLFGEPAAFDAWSERWLARLAADGADPLAVAEAMDRVNPLVHPAQPPRRGGAGGGDRGRPCAVLAPRRRARPAIRGATGPRALRGTRPANVRRRVPDVLRDVALQAEADSSRSISGEYSPRRAAPVQRARWR